MSAKSLLSIFLATGLFMLYGCSREGPTDVGPSTDAPAAGKAAPAPADRPADKQQSDTPGDKPPPAPKLTTAVVSERSVPKEARVPNTFFAENECVRRAEPPDACSWSQSADAIVVGVVRRTRLAVDRVIGADGEGGWRWYDDCKVANPALVIDLAVERMMTGDISESVSVRVGWAQLQHFRPLPYAGDDGSVFWTRTDSKAAGSLKPGNRIVMGLHNIDGEWSLMGDTVLGVDAEDRIHVPRRPGDCLNTVPEELANKTIREAALLLRRCAATEKGAERRKLHEQHWGVEQTPAFYVAGYCTDEVPGLTVDPDGLPGLTIEESGKPSKAPSRKR